MCSNENICNFLDKSCSTKDTKQMEVISNIIKDNDDLRLLFRDLGERAKEILQSTDQKENLKNYKSAYQHKSHQLKLLRDELCHSIKVHEELEEMIKKTRNKIVNQKGILEKMELTHTLEEEDDYELQEMKQNQRNLKTQIKRLDQETTDLSQQRESMDKSLNDQQDDLNRLIEDNKELEKEKKSFECRQEEVTKKQICLKEIVDENESLIERIKSEAYECKCEAKDVKLRIENLKEKADTDEGEFRRKKEILRDLEMRENTLRTQVSELRKENKKWREILEELHREERGSRLQLHDKQSILNQTKQQLSHLISKVNLCQRCKSLENQESCEIREKSSFLMDDSSSFVTSVKSSTVCYLNKEHGKKAENDLKDSCEESSIIENSCEQNQ